MAARAVWSASRTAVGSAPGCCCPERRPQARPAASRVTRATASGSRVGAGRWGIRRRYPGRHTGNRAAASLGVVRVPTRQVRAVWTAETITVYQAYPVEIAGPAVAAGRFVPPFKPDRMTWIKPSFLWMMYRCGWATKAGQERVLAVELTRTGF